MGTLKNGRSSYFLKTLEGHFSLLQIEGSFMLVLGYSCSKQAKR